MPRFAFLASEPRGAGSADTLPGPAVTVPVHGATRAAVTLLAGASRRSRVSVIAGGAPTERKIHVWTVRSTPANRHPSFHPRTAILSAKWKTKNTSPWTAFHWLGILIRFRISHTHPNRKSLPYQVSKTVLSAWRQGTCVRTSVGHPAAYLSQYCPS